MVDLTDVNFDDHDATLDDFLEAVARNHAPSERVYLGGSEIGKPCSRELYYSFHKVAPQHFQPKTYLNFDDGHGSEDKTGGIFKQIDGIELITHEGDRQIGYEAVGGHMKMHLDGMIKGVKQAPKTWHIWEHKCVNEKKFRDLQRKKVKLGPKEALEAWDETYFGQSQVYMGLANATSLAMGGSGVKRHYLTVATPGTRDIMSCRTNFQPEKFKALIEKAESIVYAKEPPPPISDKADYYICRWCNFNEHCHGSKVAAVNCRTCAHVTAQTDGTWHCGFHNNTLSFTKQMKGCSKHLFIPQLVPFADAVKFDKDANTITYVTPNGKAFTNAEKNEWSEWASGTPEITSKDLQHLDAVLVEGDEHFFAAAAVFDPTIASVKKAKKKPETPLAPLDDALPEWM